MNWVTKHELATGLEYLEIDSPLCHARIFLQGAQIEFFQPKGQTPLLWSSTANDYQTGISIRGGIPICWPWFGTHDNPDWPAHGFARIKQWQVIEVKQADDDSVTIKMALPQSEFDPEYWPHDSEVLVEFVLTDSLTVSLININKSSQAISLTQALHSYFPIADIHQLSVTGLADADYIEFNQGPYKQEDDKAFFDRETDRVYDKLGTIQKLHTQNDKGEEAIIQVSRESSQSAVLWNPWIDKSKRLSRFNDEDYLTMVCLEAANVRSDSLELAPGATHKLTTQIKWA